MLLLLSILACKGDPAAPVDDTDTGDGVIRESTVWTETDPPDDTVETGIIETGDTGVAITLVALELYPGPMVVGIGAELPLRVIGTDSEGQRGPVDASVYVSDEERAEVVDGVLRILGEGAITVTATAEELSATTVIEARADETLNITVVDAHTGEAIPGARVSVDGFKHVADEAGFASVLEIDGSPVDITVWGQDAELLPATYFSVSAREVVLPLRYVDDEDSALGLVDGDVDFSLCEAAAWDEQIIGLAAPALQSHPLFFNGADLLAEERPVDFYGIEVDVAGNVYLQEVDESWSASVDDDAPVAMWTLAGPIAISTMTSGIGGVDGALDLMIEDIGSVRYAWTDGMSAGDSATLTPELSFDDVVVVETAELPASFSSDDVPLLMILEDLGESGRLVVGLGHGEGTVDVAAVADGGWVSEGRSVLAYAEVGGTGTGGARVLTQATVEGGLAVVESWMDAPALADFDGETAGFSLSTDEGGRMVRVYVESFSGGARDLYLPPGTFSGAIPMEGPTFSMGRMIWRFTSVRTETGTYDDAYVEGEMRPDELEADATHTGLLQLQVTGG